MKEILINKLLEYIRENNPDLLMQLKEDGKVTEYLSNKLSTVNALLNHSGEEQPAYIIEEACMDVLTQELKPSKYNYISSILEEEFETTYRHLKESGLLKFEVLNMVNECQPVFDDLNFSEENEDNQFIRYAIIGTISEYIERIVTSE
jgi:hypothetical protein